MLMARRSKRWVALRCLMLALAIGQAKRRAQGIRRDYSDALDENMKESQWFHEVAGKDTWHESAKVLQWVDAQEG